MLNGLRMYGEELNKINIMTVDRPAIVNDFPQKLCDN